MAVTEATEVRKERTDKREGIKEFIPAALTGAGNTDECIFPVGCQGASVILKITAGSGYVSTTNSGITALEAGTADWDTWKLGTITADSDVVDFPPCTAIRATWASGTVKLSVRFY